MLKRKLLLSCVIISICLAISVVAQNAPDIDAIAKTSKVTSPPVGTTAGESRRTGMDPVDDRVELREYLFPDTDEMLPYAVFVSSKVKKDEKAPYVLALHGFSGNHGTFMRTGCVEAAEQNGYILVGVMGYSPSGPFGRTMGARGRRGAPTGRGDAPTGRGPGTPGAAPGGRGDAPAGRGPGMMGANRGTGAPGAAPGGRGMMMGRGPTIGGTKETDSAKVSELSEKDTMYVLEMTLKEFNVDENRIYLMGHSMGGAGAMHIGEKYAPKWAAVACLAGFGSPDPKGKMKDTPLFLTAGSEDAAGRNGSTIAEQLKAEGMDVEWKEMPGLDHGGIIAGAMPDVFNFFNKHIKSEPKK